MAASRKLCGAVIGQKGQTIREFMQDSGATIRVQPLSELTPSDSERLITVTGSRERVLRAVALILNTVRGAWPVAASTLYVEASMTRWTVRMTVHMMKI